MKLQFLVISCALLLTACASAPTPKTDKPAPVDLASAATLYMYRPNNGIIGALVEDLVYVDGFKVGRLNSNEALEVRVAPGTREIIIQPHFVGFPDGEQSKLVVTATPRQNLYIRYSISFAGISAIGTFVGVNFVKSLQIVSQAIWEMRQ